MRNERVEQVCTFYGLRAPYGLWAALGAQGYAGNDEQGYAVDWGNHRGEQRAAYAMELIERARDELKTNPLDAIVMRRVMVLYGKDRMARTLSALSSSLSSLSVDVTADGVVRVLRHIVDEIGALKP